MSEAERQAAMEKWLATRPECVQTLAAEFPLGTTCRVNGTLMHLLGWNESDTLILSPVNPSEDYEEAQRQKVYLCAEHLRIRRPRPAEPCAKCGV